MRVFVPLLLMACCAAGQSVPRHRLTAGGGWSRESGGTSVARRKTAAGPGISYGYRFHRYIEMEVGLFTAINPGGTVCRRMGCVDVRDRFYWAPFGLRCVAPRFAGGMELSAGGGGLAEVYTGRPGYSWPREGLGGYFAASAAVPIGGSGRFWLGVTPRFFLANSPGVRDRWLQIAGELSIRFGKRRFSYAE